MESVSPGNITEVSEWYAEVAAAPKGPAAGQNNASESTPLGWYEYLRRTTAVGHRVGIPGPFQQVEGNGQAGQMMIVGET